jgi:hypothetical protein
MNFQFHSPRSEDGGAILEPAISTVSKSGKAAELFETLGSIAQCRPNPKILGESTVSSNGLD